MKFLPLVFLLLANFGFPCSTAFSQQGLAKFDLDSKIDAYLDLRFDAPRDATEKLLAEMAKMGWESPAQLESLLRAPRASYPDASEWIGKTTRHDVECYHVDYQSGFLLYVPEDFSEGKPVPLVFVGHGGNSSMSPQRAESTAAMYLKIYAPAISKKMGAIVVAPISGRGWGNIGNSLIFSTLSKLQRMFSIDPDRVFITGQSMGGHLGYRSALSLPDHWGAVSPHSGGYDFVAKKSIGNLINVPGFAIWGVREPYGINVDNRSNEKWAQAHGLKWKFVEKNGGHTIYQDELPNVAEFFQNNPRNLYRDSVYIRAGGSMKFEKTWGIKGWPEHTVYSDKRPLRWNLRHWLEIEPRPDQKEPLTILARYTGSNSFEVASNQVRQFFIYLHPKMIDFDKPVSVTVNGQEIFNDKVLPDPRIMFDMAREFDDRGRVFWGRIDLEIASDSEVTIPESEAASSDAG